MEFLILSSPNGVMVIDTTSQIAEPISIGGKRPTRPVLVSRETKVATFKICTIPAAA